MSSQNKQPITSSLNPGLLYYRYYFDPTCLQLPHFADQCSTREAKLEREHKEKAEKRKQKFRD
ncbi:MAG: hypothetical protein AAF597_19930, partial [Bacteroidota bacterium]